MAGGSRAIHGERPGSVRFDLELTPRQRNCADNLLVLCPTCHSSIDGPEGARRYPAELLRQWKEIRRRENAAKDNAMIPNVPKQELLRVVRLLADPGVFLEGDSTEAQVPPLEKIRFNALSEPVAEEIRLGISQANRLRKLLEHEEVVQRDVAAVVAGALVAIYQNRRREGILGDALFRAVQYDLCQGEFTDQRLQAALAVESYFFETCDIFERPS